MEKSLEQRVEQAIVEKFFEPTWLVTTQQVMDPNTGVFRTETVPTQIESGMTRVAKAIYDEARSEIIRKVLERIDIDSIVEQWAPKIAADVVAKLNEKPNNSYWNTNPSKSERDKMLEKVYEQVAEEFGRQCVEHLKNTGGLLGVLESSKDEHKHYFERRPDGHGLRCRDCSYEIVPE